MYSPGFVPDDPLLLGAALREELQRLAQELAAPRGLLQLTPTTVAPPKPREGMVALADGANWNPGAGAGFYGYRGATWRKLD